MKPPKFLFAVAASLCITQASARSNASAELYDYLVQDVCVDAKGQAIKGDPAVCSSKRNIAIGEPSPYLVTDWHTVRKRSYAAWNSIPVRGEDGETRVLTSRNLDGNFGSDFAFSFDETSDSYDLMDLTHGSHASFIRTSDGGCLDQVFSPALLKKRVRTTRFNRRRAASRPNFKKPSRRAGGWIVFPLDTPPSAWPQSSFVTNLTALTPLQQREGCAAGSALGVTFWNAPGLYHYEGNEDGQRKALMTIRSDHFAGRDLASENNALESFYFTREYGMTRWEAWVPRARCVADAARVPKGRERSQCFPENGAPARGDFPELDLRARCKDMNVTDTDHPDVSRWGDQDWVRVDCRDLTRYVELDEPVLMLDKRMGQINGIDDIDF